MTLAHRLAERLALATRDSAGHEDEGHVAPHFAGPLKSAAVLVAFVDRPHPTLLLTRRQGHLRSHAGQVAFPGGRADPVDADAVATALREAHEEVALPHHAASIIGALAPYRTGSGYSVTPVLAVIAPDLPLMPDPEEVAHLFEARCDHVFDPSMLTRKSAIWAGVRRDYWETMVDGERLWGVTAGIIRNIGRMLRLDVNPRALNRDVAA